jgi:thiamine kinase-like enzyme
VTAARSLSSSPRPDAPEPRDDQARIAQVLDRVPEFVGFTAAPLPGGLTNTNYRIVAGDRQAVIRLSSPQSALLAIDRDVEHHNAVAAAEAGVGPGVVDYRPDAGALLIDWVDGRTFAAADLDDSATLQQVAATCRQLHAGPRFRSEFDMFALQRRYLDLVVSSGFPLPADYLDHMPAVNQLREAMATHAPEAVPCHNDLLAANIMAGSDQLWFIDFEYSGNGDPYFELGNIASESHLSVERLAELVTAYDEGDSPSHLARARLFGLMSDYGWTLWASIQAATSDLAFDFWAWGMEKYERALALFHDPGLLPQLLTDVQAP